MSPRRYARILRSSAAVLVTAALAASLAAPAVATTPTRVKPVNGKWGGTAQTVQCDRTPAEEITAAAAPPATCAGEPVPNVEVLAFTLSGRRVTALSLDVQIQCLSSDSADRSWVANQLRFGPSDEFGYVGLNGSTAIPPSGLLRIEVPVEDNFDHVGGRIRMTLDFRGAKAKAAVFFDGVHQEDGYFQRCVSTQNAASVFAPRLLKRT